MIPGIFLGYIAMISWGFADYFNKIILNKITLKQMLYYGLPINALFYIILIPFFFKSQNIDLFSLVISVVSGIMLNAGWMAFLIAMSKEKLTLVSAIGSSYPAITIILGVLILKEKILSIEIIAILLILIGLVLTCFSLKEKIRMTNGLVWGIACIILWGVGYFIQKMAFDRLGWFIPILINSIILLLVWPIWLRKENHKVQFEKKTFHLIFLWILMALVGYIAYSIGVTIERVSIMTTISGMAPIVAVFLGYFLLKERVETSQYLGIIMVIIGGVLLAF